METCPICNREFKNKNALRLHNQHKHKEEIQVEVPRETGISVDETPTEIFTAPYRVKLFGKDGKLVLEYPVIGNKALEEAKANAIKRNYRIEIKQVLI